MDAENDIRLISFNEAAKYLSDSLNKARSELSPDERALFDIYLNEFGKQLFYGASPW